MRTIKWQLSAAISANVPFAPPSSAGAPRMIGVQNLAFIPATSGVSANPIFEVGVASGAANVSGGQISFDVANQEFGAGDGLAVSGVVFIDVFEEDDYPQQ